MAEPKDVIVLQLSPVQLDIVAHACAYSAASYMRDLSLLVQAATAYKRVVDAHREDASALHRQIHLLLPPDQEGDSIVGLDTPFSL